MKTTLKVLSLATSLLAFSAHAAEKFIYLEDNSAILGAWHMTGETPKLRMKQVPVSNKWTFTRDGFMTATAHDRRFSGSGSTMKVKYSIEKGMIKKQFAPGRNKYENCKAIKLTKEEMILHCAFNYFFFTR